MWRLGERCFGKEPVCQTHYHCGGIGRVDSPGACPLKREGVVLQSGRDRPSPGLAFELIHEPVYISIDKDVLRKQDAITDWSNGDMTLMQLQAVLRIIYGHEKVIGVDITGECSATLDYFSELEDAEINNEANEELLRMILEENHP